MPFVCGQNTVEAEASFGGAAISVKCGRWSCPTCQPERQAQLIAIGMSGHPNRFVTITNRRRPGLSPVQAAREMVEAWRTIIRRFRRINPGKEVEYFCVFEATRNGWPHLHILMRAPYMPQQWLSAQMKGLTGSPVCWIEYIEDSGRAAAYVAKYTGKEPHKFGTLKRYWRSAGYKVASESEWVGALSLFRTWVIRTIPISMIREDWKRWGRDILDLGAGAIGWGALSWEPQHVRVPP